MPKCRGNARPRRGWPLVLGAAIAVMSGACASIHIGVESPDDLAGDWIDVRHATASDTSIWRLARGGADDIVHVTWAREGGEGLVRHETSRRYALWYVTGALADTSTRRLCFNRRPGRSAGTCYAFALDTVSSGAPGAVTSSRRQLILRSYSGEHVTADRILLERQP